jgi:hypothetical protein
MITIDKYSYMPGNGGGADGGNGSGGNDNS